MTRTGIQLGIYGYGVLGRRPEIRLGEVLDFVAGAGVDGVEVMSNSVRERNARPTATRSPQPVRRVSSCLRGRLPTTSPGIESWRPV
jgi:hypothetical protein